MSTVLHVSETTEGGVGRVLRDLADAERAHGWRVVLAAPHDEALAPAFDAAHDWVPGAKPGPRFPGAVRQLAAVVRQEQPDLVHLHSSMAGMVGRLVVRRRRPTVHQPHSWSFFALEGAVRRGAQAWERWAARWTDVALCVSQDERRAGQALGLQVRYEVVPNGVDLDRWSPSDRAAARAEVAPGEGPLVVCVGRLHRQKGQHLLLDAWPQVLREVPQARLALVGDGPDRAELEARLPVATTFVGRSAQGPAWLAAADVVAQPSVWEGMPLSVLEAMACGRSVVATDVTGMAEVLVNGTGALVPPGDAGALAGALVQRLRDPSLAAAEGEAGRRRAEQEHDGRARVAQVVALSRELVRS